MVNYIWVPIGVSIVAVLFAAYLVFYVLRKDTGTPGMQKISNAIFAGASAFLSRQYRTIALLALLAAVLVACALAFLGQGSEADKINLAWHTALAFLVGALCSGVSGYIGMSIAVQSNSRTASAATRSLGEALVVSLTNPAVTPSLIVGFGFGASFVALFAQLGGGIYTKAADVGADLVGKVEAGIPEDDPRNPAVIADLVGDNVGDCAGRGADLFESTAAENIGTMILGAALYQATGNVGWMLFPLVLGAFGIIASAIGLLYIRPSSVVEPDKSTGRDPGVIAMNQLNIGYYITCAISVVGVFLGSYLLLDQGHIPANYGLPAWLWYAFAGCVGILLSVKSLKPL